MQSEIESTAEALRALSNPKRLAIVHWLADPTKHFPPQRDGDLIADGVCVGFITKKINRSVSYIRGRFFAVSRLEHQIFVERLQILS